MDCQVTARKGVQIVLANPNGIVELHLEQLVAERFHHLTRYTGARGDTRGESCRYRQDRMDSDGCCKINVYYDNIYIKIYIYIYAIIYNHYQ